MGQDENPEPPTDGHLFKTNKQTKTKTGNRLYEYISIIFLIFQRATKGLGTAEPDETSDQGLGLRMTRWIYTMVYEQLYRFMNALKKQTRCAKKWNSKLFILVMVQCHRIHSFEQKLTVSNWAQDECVTSQEAYSLFLMNV